MPQLVSESDIAAYEAATVTTDNDTLTVATRNMHFEYDTANRFVRTCSIDGNTAAISEALGVGTRPAGLRTNRSSANATRKRPRVLLIAGCVINMRAAALVTLRSS